MKKQSLVFLMVATKCWAAPAKEHLEVQVRAAAPAVTITNGTVFGQTSNNVDTYNGIPFAQQPVGNLRLRQPQSLTTGFPGGTFDASGSPGACPQFNAQSDNLQNLPESALAAFSNSPLGQIAMNQTESCLTLNVQRPAGTTNGSKLPVIFWIFGGSFEFGSSVAYDGSNILQYSASLGEPVVWVAANYRLNGFGFLPGSEVAAEGVSNLGLRDQRLALQWVAENIGAFGGDPDRVTLWGYSAGSICVADQLTINGGDNTYNGKPLFRGAIMSSGSLAPATDISSSKPQATYDHIVANSPCAGMKNSLDCLRNLPYEDFLNAVTSVPTLFSYNSLDLAYLARPDVSDGFFSQSPEISFSTGQFAKVPLIIGDEEDEGTLFSVLQNNLTTNDDLINYLTTYFIDGNPNAKQLVTNLTAQYSDEPLIGQPDGSPFRTGGLNNIYPQFKRLAAILGDIVFALIRRRFLEYANSNNIKTWSYLSSYLHYVPVLGTFHGTGNFLFLGAPPNSTIVTRTYHTYFLNFINNLDPNVGPGDIVEPLIPWPQWTSSSRTLMAIDLTENTLSTDDFRQVPPVARLGFLEDIRGSVVN